MLNACWMMDMQMDISPRVNECISIRFASFAHRLLSAVRVKVASTMFELSSSYRANHSFEKSLELCLHTNYVMNIEIFPLSSA